MSDFVIKNGVLTKYTGNGGDVVIPDGVTEIQKGRFYGCTSLTSVQFPDSIKTIGNSAFYNCTNLISAQLPDNVEKIGIAAFAGCANLKEVSLPENCQLSENSFPKKTKITYRKKQNIHPAQSLSESHTVTLKLEEILLVNGVDVNDLISHYPPGTKIILKLEKTKPGIRKKICTFAPLSEAEIRKLGTSSN